MDLAILLRQWTQRSFHPGAKLRRVSFTNWWVEIEFVAMFTPGQFRGLLVKAIDVEDWCFAPSHTLLEGTDRLELITDDPKLTRAYLESLDCEGDRKDYPDRVFMLRNGESYVIAEGFEADWLNEEAR